MILIFNFVASFFWLVIIGSILFIYEWSLEYHKAKEYAERFDNYYFVTRDKKGNEFDLPDDVSGSVIWVNYHDVNISIEETKAGLISANNQFYNDDTLKDERIEFVKLIFRDALFINEDFEFDFRDRIINTVRANKAKRHRMLYYKSGSDRGWYDQFGNEQKVI